METDNKPTGRFDKTKGATVDREKIEKVISGNTKVRKNSVRKFTDVFIAEDANSVRSHIFNDVFVPAIKKLVTDIIKDGVDMLVNGRVTRPNKSNSFFSDQVSYDRFSSSSNSPKPIRTINRFSYDDIEFETRTEAEMVLDHMMGCIGKYGFVTVAAMYDMVGRTAPFTAENYGWTTINNAYVDRVYGGGYVIKLPRAIPIER
jgi:hypothetical protein